VKECGGEGADCTSLLAYGDGGVKWLSDYGLHDAYVHTITLDIYSAIGWDLEGALMKAFEGLWDIPEYETYMQELVTMGSVPGSYRNSCKKCRYIDDQQRRAVLSCTCEAHKNVTVTSYWVFSPGCVDMTTVEGYLYCAQWAPSMYSTFSRGSYLESCEECHLSSTGTLYCKCRNPAGEYLPSALQVGNFDPRFQLYKVIGHEVGNVDGTLTLMYRDDDPITFYHK